MSFKIKKINDIIPVLKLDFLVFPADEARIEDYQHNWLVTDSDNDPIAYACLKVLNRSTLYFTRAGVLPTARGKGLQLRLIRARVNWARRNAFKTIITYTSYENAASYHNLQKAGFKLYYPEYLYAGREFLYWIKSL